jgi:ABC-type transport system involved in multi-copper enzyme maturation permease subunit
MSSVLQALREAPRNPVLRRELDERARSTRAVVAITLWLVLLGGVACLVYLAYTVGDGANAIESDPARIGRDIFAWTLFGMTGLVLFLVPAFTASAIAGERTRQTLVPVLLTSMGPFAVVLGKMLAAVAFTALLVVSTAPILAVAFFVGGVGVFDVVSGLAMVLLTALLVGSVGIACSAVASKVQTAIVTTYGFVLAIALGSFIALAVVGVMIALTNGFADEPPRLFLAVNPFVGVASAVRDTGGSFAANPLDGLNSLNRELADGGGEVSAMWRWYVVFCALSIYTALWIATGRLRTPMPVER